MTKKELADVLKYSSPDQILIINTFNQVQKIICPFEVMALCDIGSLQKWQIVLVQEVKVTRDIKTVFIINGQAYHYYYFEILV